MTLLRRVSAFEAVQAAAVVGGMVFLAAPLGMVVLNSIGSGPLPVFPPTDFSLDAYGRIPWRWVDSFLNSMILALAVAALSSILGTAAALALSRARFRSPTLIDGILRSPLQIPALVVGIAFLQSFSWIYGQSGVELRGTFPGLLLAHTSVALPYVLTVVLARLASFDERLEEAAFGLGASAGEALRLVTLPVIGPAILSGAFFAFLLSLDNVPLSLFLVSGSFTLLPVDLFTAIQFDLTRSVYAVSTIVCLVTTAVVVLLYRRLTSAVAVTRM